MSTTIRMLIEQFIEGSMNGCTGTKSRPGNLKIKGDQLIHYQTPIAERTEQGGFIINLSQYSIQTGNVQKQLKAALQEIEYKTVKRVPRDYKGSLAVFE